MSAKWVSAALLSARDRLQLLERQGGALVQSEEAHELRDEHAEARGHEFANEFVVWARSERVPCAAEHACQERVEAVDSALGEIVVVQWQQLCAELGMLRLLPLPRPAIALAVDVGPCVASAVGPEVLDEVGGERAPDACRGTWR